MRGYCLQEDRSRPICQIITRRTVVVVLVESVTTVVDQLLRRPEGEAIHPLLVLVVVMGPRVCQVSSVWRPPVTQWLCDPLMNEAL